MRFNESFDRIHPSKSLIRQFVKGQKLLARIAEQRNRDELSIKRKILFLFGVQIEKFYIRFKVVVGKCEKFKVHLKQQVLIPNLK